MNPVLIALAGLLAGCTPNRFNEAPPDASISVAANAPGFLIVGLADESEGSALFRTAIALAIGFRREDGRPAVMNRYGCGSPQGVTGKGPCDLAKLDWKVLQVSPGLWRLSEISRQSGNFNTRETLSGRLRLGQPVEVHPGEIVYIGDLVLSTNYDALTVSLRRHGRDDAAAQRALVDYPGLRNATVVFKDPRLLPSPQ